MHMAVIPAREGSQGFKHKNRLLFDITADFLDSVGWIDDVIVSTDDPTIVEYAKKRNYSIHHRSADLAGPAVSIKQVFESVVGVMEIDHETVLWLFYLTIAYKQKNDFLMAKKIIEQKEVASLCSFVPASTHPYKCWKFDDKKNELEQFIPNNTFRRQDHPAAWEHYHYLSCFKVSELPALNHEIINRNTHPVFLKKETVDQLVEIDTQEDYEKWKKIQIVQTG